MSRSYQLLIAVLTALSAGVACGPIWIGSSDESAAGAANDSSGGGGKAAVAGGSAGRGTRGGGGAHAGGSGTGGGGTGGGGTGGGGTSNGGGASDGGASDGGASDGGASDGGASDGGSRGSAAGASAAGSGGAAATGQAGAAGAPASCSDGELRLSGRVASPTGEPLSGVTITLEGDDNVQTTTGASGDYAIDGLCPGAYTLIPSREGLGFCSESASYSKLDRDVTEDFTGSPDGCDPAPIERRLLVVAFDPWLTSGAGAPARLSAIRGWEDPLSLAERFVRGLAAVSNGHVHYEITGRRLLDSFPAQLDSFGYEAADYAACLDDTAQCHAPEAADYVAIADEQDLCGALESGSADEIWLLGGPHFGFAPWQTLPWNCRRTADISGFDYAGGLAGMFRSFQARSELNLAQVFADPGPDRWVSRFDEFRRTPTYPPSTAVSGCGSSGAAPNAVRDHPFDSRDAILSYCDAYSGYPFEPSSLEPLNLADPVSCTDWDCSEFGFLRYWFRHLPQAKGIDPEGRFNDWWRYLLTPDDRVGTSVVSCSSSYESGWCENVIDGYHGVCNVDEWATAARNTGWVEFHWRSEKLVQRVRIYDRACSERVRRGHLEFSDDSSPLGFGPLENLGLEATELTFEPRLLTGLRVVIDEGSDANPGFGEIIVD